MLTHYFPRTKIRKEKSLLGGKDNDDGDLVQDEMVSASYQNFENFSFERTIKEQPDIIVSHWHQVRYMSRV